MAEMLCNGSADGRTDENDNHKAFQLEAFKGGFNRVEAGLQTTKYNIYCAK
jgi:hypothetical protein